MHRPGLPRQAAAPRSPWAPVRGAGMGCQAVYKGALPPCLASAPGKLPPRPACGKQDGPGPFQSADSGSAGLGVAGSLYFSQAIRTLLVTGPHMWERGCRRPWSRPRATPFHAPPTPAQIEQREQRSWEHWASRCSPVTHGGPLVLSWPSPQGVPRPQLPGQREWEGLFHGPIFPPCPVHAGPNPTPGHATRRHLALRRKLPEPEISLVWVTSLVTSTERLLCTKTWLLSPGTSLGGEKDLLSKAARGSRWAPGGDGGTHKARAPEGLNGAPHSP